MDSGNSEGLLSTSCGGGSSGGGGGVGGGDDQELESSQGRHSGFFNPLTSMCMSSFVDTVQYQFHGFDPNFMINHTNQNNGGRNNNCNNYNNSIDMVWPNKFGSFAQTTPLSISSPFLIVDNNNNNDDDNQRVNTGLQSNRVRPASGEDHPGRNPKKRYRATRKAPTTVLTTDTNNFRQMVQEFTGIPAPPLTTFPGRTRIDLFGGLGIQVANNGYGYGNGHGSSSSPHAPIPVRPFSFAPSSSTSTTETPNPVLAFQSLIRHPLSYDSVSSLEPKAIGSLLNQYALAAAATTTTNATTTATAMSDATSMIGSGKDPSPPELEHDRHGDCSENVTCPGSSS